MKILKFQSFFKIFIFWKTSLSTFSFFNSRLRKTPRKWPCDPWRWRASGRLPFDWSVIRFELSPRMKLRVEIGHSCYFNRLFSRVLRKWRFLRDYWELEADFLCGIRSCSDTFISGEFFSTGCWKMNILKAKSYKK